MLQKLIHMLIKNDTHNKRMQTDVTYGHAADTERYVLSSNEHWIHQIESRGNYPNNEI